MEERGEEVEERRGKGGGEGGEVEERGEERKEVEVNYCYTLTEDGDTALRMAETQKD